MLPCEDGVTSADIGSYLDGCAAVIVQQPNFFGCIEDLENLVAKSHDGGCISVVSVNPISLGILEAPGILGADIVVGEGQPLGNPMSFGGPMLGFLASTSVSVSGSPR